MWQFEWAIEGWQLGSSIGGATLLPRQLQSASQKNEAQNILKTKGRERHLS